MGIHHDDGEKNMAGQEQDTILKKLGRDRHKMKRLAFWRQEEKGHILLNASLTKIGKNW